MTSRQADCDARNGSAPTVLVVDDDPGTRETLEWCLAREGYRPQMAGSGAEGLAVARSSRPDVVIIDLRLPDMPGTAVISALQQDVSTLRWLLISGFLTTPITVEAMRRGACSVLDKPFTIEDLLGALRRALIDPTRHATIDVSPVGRLLHSPTVSAPRSAAERWVRYVLKACESEGDFKTLDKWARHIGVSSGTLSETCRILRIRPHDARDLARVLRAVVRRAPSSRDHLEVLLDISDRRTLRTLMDRAGVTAGAKDGSASVDQFLQRQRFVSHENEGLQLLKKLLEGMNAESRGKREMS